MEEEGRREVFLMMHRKLPDPTTIPALREWAKARGCDVWQHPGGLTGEPSTLVVRWDGRGHRTGFFEGGNCAWRIRMVMAAIRAAEGEGDE